MKPSDFLLSKAGKGYGAASSRPVRLVSSAGNSGVAPGKLKISGGTPPILTKHGWLILYHGVSKTAESGSDGCQLCYSAGVMLLSKEHPCEIRYRSAEPVLTPLLRGERDGIVPNVVFPTGIDRRDDLGSPGRFDVYYGMADNRIGVARLDLPEHLPLGALADPPEAKV
jgi:beta-1,2-mannobiose phosphorylase / 1,2-beta-oligomannan phosphorylase